MKEIEKTVYEKAVFALCSLAYVKWPLQLIGKKIAFIVDDVDAEVKIYDTITRVIIANEKGGSGNATICLNYVDYPSENQRILVYNPEKKLWEYCQSKNIRDYIPVKSIVFETKLFGLFTI